MKNIPSTHTEGKINTRSKYIFNLIKSVVLSTSMIISGTTLYQNEVDPASTQLARITNHDTEILFFGMNHIGSEEYYTSIKNKIESYYTKGYIILYEGIRVESEQDQTKLTNITGHDVSERGRGEQATKLGLVGQNTAYLIPQHSISYNVDVGVSDLENYSQPSENITAIYRQESDSKKGNHEMYLPKYVQKSIQNYAIKNPVMDPSLEKRSHIRNEHLASEIMTGKYGKKIIVIYGNDHLPGLVSELEKRSPGWDKQILSNEKIL